MAELLITVFLLLAIENALFSIAFRNERFLTFSYERGNMFPYAIMLGAIPAVSVIIGAMISETESILLALLTALILSGAVTAYEKFVKKNAEWYFALSLVINSAVVVLLSPVLAEKNITVSPTAYAVFSGIAASASALCFCGVKNNFYRVKRNIIMTYVASAALLIMAIVSLLGFAF